MAQLMACSSMRKLRGQATSLRAGPAMLQVHALHNTHTNVLMSTSKRTGIQRSQRNSLTSCLHSTQRWQRNLSSVLLRLRSRSSTPRLCMKMYIGKHGSSKNGQSVHIAMNAQMESMLRNSCVSMANRGHGGLEGLQTAQLTNGKATCRTCTTIGQWAYRRSWQDLQQRRHACTVHMMHTACGVLTGSRRQQWHRHRAPGTAASVEHLVKAAS